MDFYRGILGRISDKKAFTLTEVLIAVGIVGVIAALVMPKVISNYQMTVMNNQYARLQQTLSDSLRSLAVKENKANFGATTMWVKSGSTYSSDSTAGMFIKKYLNISKYLGDGSTSEAKDAFADEYYDYAAGGVSTAGKSRSKFAPEVSGACAILKSGASICLKPQIGSEPAQGIIDMNGKKGPNVLERDYRRIKLDMVEFSDAETNLIAGASPAEVITIKHENIVSDKDIPCGVDDYSKECCLYKAENGAITGPDHQCCQNPSVSSQIPVCASDILLSLDMYPSTCKLNYATTSTPKCSEVPSIKGGSSTATQNGKTIKKLPATPPMIYLFCDGVRVGAMNGMVLKSVLESSSYQKHAFMITYPHCSSSLSCALLGVTGVFAGNPTCGWQSGEGIQAKKSSIVFTTGGAYRDYQYNGVTWTVKYR